MNLKIFKKNAALLLFLSRNAIKNVLKILYVTRLPKEEIALLNLSLQKSRLSLLTKFIIKKGYVLYSEFLDVLYSSPYHRLKGIKKKNYK